MQDEGLTGLSLSEAQERLKARGMIPALSVTRAQKNGAAEEDGGRKPYALRLNEDGTLLYACFRVPTPGK